MSSSHHAKLLYPDFSERVTRHSKHRPCPICDGYPELPQGHRIRCVGFTRGNHCYCTREEFAGRLPLSGTSPPSYRHRLEGDCPCGRVHDHSLAPPKTILQRPVAALSIETRDAIYLELLQELPELRPECLDDLTRRGLSAEQIAAGRFRSIPTGIAQRQHLLTRLKQIFEEPVLRRCAGFLTRNDRLGFWTARAGFDGYVIPYTDEHGRVTGLQMKQLGGKYLTARGTSLAAMYLVAGERQDTLYLTEGGLKAYVASCLGPCWCFGVAGQALSDDHVEVIKRMAPPRVAVAFDREDNESTAKARTKALDMLARTGIPTFDAVWNYRQ